MARSLSVPLLLLAALAVSLVVSPAAGARQGPRRLGGVENVDVNEEGVQRAVGFAISEYNKGSNDAYHSRAVQVVRARRQIVAGVKYYLDVELGRTTCTKSQPNLTDCPFHEQPEMQRRLLCSFEIYSVPWLNKISMLNSHCQNA